MNLPGSRWLVILRIAIGALFVVSGFMKLMEPPPAFLAVIQTYEMAGGGAARAAAFVLPWAEFLGGLFLVAGFYTTAALSVLWVLNTLFIAALTQALIRKLPVQDCGCFGKSFHPPIQWTLVLDLALWASFAVLFARRRPASDFSLDRILSSSQPPR